jgi:hypothetical protein
MMPRNLNMQGLLRLEHAMSELLLILRVAIRAPRSRRWLLSQVVDLSHIVSTELQPIRRPRPPKEKPHAEVKTSVA